MMSKRRKKNRFGVKAIFGVVATEAAHWTGSVWAFGSALLVIVL